MAARKEDDILKMGLVIGGIWLFSRYTSGVAQAATMPGGGTTPSTLTTGPSSLIDQAVRATGQVIQKLPPSSNVAVTSDVVAWVQQSLDFLIDAGIPVDGQMGPLTQGAIVTYQGNKGLYASGQVDQSLIDALNGDIAATTTQYPTLQQFMDPNWQPVY